MDDQVHGSRRRFRLKSLGLLVLSLGVLFLIAPFVDGDRVTEVEESVFRFLNDLPGFLYPLLWPFMQLGNLLAVPVALVVALLFKKWRLSIGIALIGLCKLYATGVVKDLVVRHRPAAVLGQVHARDDTGLGQAFVSGHVVVVVALATLAHPYVSPRLRILFWSLAGIVAFGRVYVGAHLPLDVVGGAALGCAMACAIHVVLGPPKPEDAAVTSSE